MSSLSSLVVCGPSGSGKSTLLRRLLNEFKDFFRFSVSHTTREKRREEENGREYHFVSERDFRSMIAKKQFLEWTNFSGHLYGTSFRALEDVKKSKRIPVLDLELKAVLNLKNSKEFSAKFVFIKPKDFQQLERNLRMRGTESEESLEKRLKRAKEDLKEVEELSQNVFDLIIINEELEKAFEELKKFLENDISEAKKRLNQ